MPKSMTKRILIAAALLAATTFIQAQPMPPGKWWRRPEVARELELTREQQDKLDEAFRGAANDLIDAKGEVEKLQVALRGELDRPQLRRTELQRLAGQLTAARGKLFERELMMLVDMRSILDEDQWGKLRHHLDQMQEGRERGGAPMPNRPQRRRP